MRSDPQRRHLSLIDGIVAGEGDGPLIPTPVDAGVVVFSESVAWGDHVAARLMGFDAAAIPILRESLRDATHPLVEQPATPPEVVWNGTPRSLASVPAARGEPFRPPRGWRGHL
jgi:uncharacterized protein (DUF362 family)